MTRSSQETRMMIVDILISLLFVIITAAAELPPPLTIDNFDSTIKDGLHFIEFFSPYCSHCKQLAPKWESTYEHFQSDSKVLNIYMHQVNCVESGDLCDRESIRYYPALRLYSGDGEKGVLKASYPSKYKRNEESMIKFMKEQSTSGLLDLPNKSQHIKTTEMLKILNGDLNEPILISFWPTNDEQLNMENFDSMNLDKAIKDFYFEECPECFELRNYWGRLSNQLLPIIKTGFVNCKSNPKICKHLGLKELITAGNNFKNPIIMAFLPRSGGNSISYNFDITDYKRVVHWCDRLIENYQFNETDVRDLSSKMALTRSMGRSPSSDLPLDNKVSFIYYYDKETSVEEDFNTLPHLLQHIMDSPFDISIYKSSDVKFDEFMLAQEKSVLKYIDYNNSEPFHEFNEDMYNLNSLTTLPTLLCFKDNSLIHEKYINFEPHKVRDVSKLKDFITKNSIPFLNELTPELYTQFFPTRFNNKIHDKSDLVVITLIDTKNFQEFMNLKLQMSVEAHEFNHLQKTENFAYITSKRQDKMAKVEKLKSLGNAKSDDIIDEMRTKIDHTVHRFNTIFTYMDISDESSLQYINEKGWNINNRIYKSGDVLIISRFDKFYWDKDLYGANLINDPYTIRETLKNISFGNHGIMANLIKSPYGDKFRFMDRVHGHGIIGYLITCGLIYTLISVGRLVLRRRRNKRLVENRNRGLGILGVVPKKD